MEVSHLEIEEKKWYVLWTSTVRDVHTIQYLLSKVDAQLWNPCFTQLCNEEEKSIPIFPGYYFVKCTIRDVSLIEETCTRLRYTSVKFLKSESGRAIPLTLEEEDSIRQLESQKFEYDRTFCVGRRVVVQDGPFKDLEADILDVKSDHIKIQMQIFQRLLGIWIKKESCELI